MVKIKINIQDYKRNIDSSIKTLTKTKIIDMNKYLYWLKVQDNNIIAYLKDVKIDSLNNIIKTEKEIQLYKTVNNKDKLFLKLCEEFLNDR